MGDSRGVEASATVDSAQRLVYWVLGLLVALLSVGRLPGMSRAATDGVAAGATGSAAATPVAVTDGGVPRSAHEDSPFLSSCVAHSAHPECCEGWRLLDEYRRLYEPSAPGADAAAPRTRFRHLIATVPDPVESGHGDLFDGVLEGVEEAVARGVDGVSYVRDRSFLPWAESDDAKRALRCWESHPGVVLYRPSGGAGPDESAMVVLLVGETPTWGVRPRQLEDALSLVEKANAFPAESKRFDVLGPTFSGTAASLSAIVRRRLALDRAQTHLGLRFSIVSGSATSPSVEPTVVGSEKDAVTYSATTPTDDRLLEAMLAFICVRGGKCESSQESNVVLLTESLTAYGSGHAWKPPNAAVSRSFVEIKFPPNLAAIRRAYQAASPADSAALPEMRAPLDRAGSGKGDGTEFSGDTPVTHDLALGEILRDLSRSRVRFVGIVATDARDVLFLSQRIRAQVPDIRLFTLGSDIRYLHPDYSQIADGMLVAHASPMEEKIRSTSLEVELVESVFLAGRRLLAHETSTPRVRVSLIGHGALWQVSDDSPPLPASPASTPEGKRRRHTPMSWAFTFAFCAVGFLIVLGLVAAPTVSRIPKVEEVFDPRRSNGFLRHRGFLWALVGPCEHADLARDDRAVTAALLSVAAAPTLLFAVASFARTTDGPSSVNSALCAIIASLLVVASWLGVLRAGRRPSVSTLLLCGSATLGALLALGLGCGPQREATFNLLSGGSPVLAGLAGLGILGVGLWCWRVRLRLLDTHRFGTLPGDEFEDLTPPIAQALGEDGAAGGTGLAEVERRLVRILRSPWLVFSVVPVLVHLALFGSVAIAFIKPPHTFEEEPRNSLLILFAVLSFLPITGNFSRLVAAWIALTRLLHRLAPLRVAAALKRLPERLARRLDAQLTISTSEIADLEHSVHALGKLATLSEALATEHRECVELLELEQRYEAGVPDELHSPHQDSTHRARLVNRLLQTSGKVATSKADLDDDTRARVDDFVASLVAVFIPRYVRHFSLFVAPLVIGSMLAMLMTSLYFVQPQRLITSLIFVWVAAMIVVVFLVYVALDRDAVVSAMGGTTAGSVTWSWGLARRVAAWGILPVASMFASQYPEVSTWVSAVFEVIAKGFR